MAWEQQNYFKQQVKGCYQMRQPSIKNKSGILLSGLID